MAEIVAQNPINDRGSRPVNDHSTFDNTIPVAGTYRYGEYGVHFVADVVPDDNHKLRCKHVVRSYTLKAPMLQGIKMRKDYYLVPLSAILPLNYEKLSVTPNIGEDVDSQFVGTSVKGFTALIEQMFLNHWTAINGDVSAEGDFFFDSLQAYIKLLLVADMLIGSGSLPSAMNCHLTSRELATKFDVAFDKFFDKLWTKCFASASDGGYNCKMEITAGGLVYGINSTGVGVIEVKNFHELMTILRDGYSWTISYLNTPDGFNLASELADVMVSPQNFIISDADAPIDLAKFYAYQLVCSHFYTNDHVDYIYSAELYRQNILSLLNTDLGIDTTIPFQWNGVEYRYDTLSSFMFYNTVSGWSTSDVLDHSPLYDYLRLIFGYNRSLRFMDYFTGSRTRPLAVGDAGVAVNDGYVNVVDTMQKRWYIKLWNQVNRVGRRLSEQMKGLFPGVQTSTDWHDPIWLASTEDFVNATEVDNTGDAQIGENSVDIPVTSSFIDRAEKYAFDININDRFGIVLGITSFDLQRFYSSSIDRTFFHVDRYDKFNPFLQFMGDQKIYTKELYSGVQFSDIFSYTGRYMEYKQKYPFAFGGFINDALPGMIFLADEGRNQTTIEHLSPNYIRSYPAELDRFYNSLTGFSLGTYFHFFIINTNELISNRPMAYNPQLD